MTARGIRNNNPLNIRKGAKWVGLKSRQTDDEFCQFFHPVFGYRAATKILFNYQELHDRRSLAEIISRWAPPTENDTNAYIHSVARKLADRGTAVVIDTPLRLREQRGLLLGLLNAMTVHENGSCPYDDNLIKSGILLALSKWG